MKLPDFDAMYKDMAKGMGNRVRCNSCFKEQIVNPEHCLRHGWPKCCGYTMSLLSAPTSKRSWKR